MPYWSPSTSIGSGSVLLALGAAVGLVLLLVALSPILLLKLAKIIWIPIGFGRVVLKALWVKFERPEGYVLNRSDAPELRAEVERLRIATGAPKLDGIIVDADLNAAAASVPRVLGLMGHSHYLVVGLHLMHLLLVPLSALAGRRVLASSTRKA